MDEDMQDRVSFLEGELDTLETIVAEMIAVIVSKRIVDDDQLRSTIHERSTSFTIRQHDDLIVGTPGEHYFKGAVQVLDKIQKGLPS